jgi:hypothetical protein
MAAYGLGKQTSSPIVTRPPPSGSTVSAFVACPRCGYAKNLMEFGFCGRCGHQLRDETKIY